MYRPSKVGVVSQTVKEVLQSLVDDNLVQADKIGSSNCEPDIQIMHICAGSHVRISPVFWSFPSQQGAMIQARLASVKETRAGHLAQLADVKADIEAERLARPDSVSSIVFFRDNCTTS